MSGERLALLIATGRYDIPGLQRLRSPGRDVEGLAEVLQDPQIGGFTVHTLVDARHHEVNRAIEAFFLDRSLDDLLLLHLSCHGIKNDNGELFFAARDTDRKLLASTAVSAAFLHTQMRRCRARSIVLLLDCCYSGAFLPGSKGDTAVHVNEELGGHGRAVLTATNRTEYAWEGNHLSELEPEPSRFTGAVIAGLRSGEADGNRDGLVTVHELYDYVYERMHAAGVRQRPQLWTQLEYRVVVARSNLHARSIEGEDPQPRQSRTATYAGAQAAEAEAPFRLSGRYEFGQVLGRGDMAEVHLALDCHLGRTVGVKTLRADLARDPSFQARFRREAQSAASLNHPAIVAVHDTGEDYIDGLSIPYIVMEYVDGSTLRELLHSGRKLLPERTLEMTIGILQALEYSHRNGVVHRDIKPANVMLTRDGQIKVMNFGVSQGTVIGTAEYVSPEQAKGEQIDARSDLYSTGCLLYELLTARPPFVGGSPVAIAYQHVREEPQPPSVFNPEITPEMDTIVLKALAKDPDHRYQSADEMRTAINTCLTPQPAERRHVGGRYELGQVLGRGGMTEVYLAHDSGLGRTVAVKTLRADLARDPSLQARFRREAQSAASLNHPAIVAVYDTVEDHIDGVTIPCIVMEYVDGSSLRELLHSGPRVVPERALEITIGILQVLEYSHRNGIVHRDIKPANVMLTRTGLVKVMNFGITRALVDPGMTTTQATAVIGTAQYLSPEQAKGEEVDARSDLYSTGCLLYELLTVRPPFVGDSPVAVAYQHVREEPQPPSVFNPDITPEMDAIVLKALVKAPDGRYQSAREMRLAIKACLDGRPRPSAPPERPDGPPRRYKPPAWWQGLR